MSNQVYLKAKITFIDEPNVDTQEVWDAFGQDEADARRRLEQKIRNRYPEARHIIVCPICDDDRGAR